MHIDHLVVAARTLDQGRRAIERRLGVTMEEGGRHPDYGTHNALLSLGPTTYLEVIAIDPASTGGHRPRWYGLDTPQMRERLEHGPALIHWVVRVPDLSGHPDAHPARRGEHRWTLTVPADGELAGGGSVPSQIAWHTPPVSTVLPDRGVRLKRLVVTDPSPEALVPEVGRVEEPQVELREGPRSLRAVLATPGGEVSLGGSAPSSTA